VYYGTFPGEPNNGNPTVWVISRPHNWHPQTTSERLLNIDLVSKELITSEQIPSRCETFPMLSQRPTITALILQSHHRRFSHDAIKSGGNVWICSTGEGKLLQLSYPAMDVIQTLDLFTAKEHVNTVAVFDSSVWVVLHNLGKVWKLSVLSARADVGQSSSVLLSSSKQTEACMLMRQPVL
jgi:hypothetical protein